MKLFNDKLYYGGRDRSLHFVSLAEGSCTLGKLDPPHFSQITAIDVLQGCLITASNDKNLRIWCDDKVQGTVIGAHSTSVTALAATEELLFTAGRGELVKVWKQQQSLASLSYFSASENVLSMAPCYNAGVILGTDGGKLQMWAPAE